MYQLGHLHTVECFFVLFDFGVTGFFLQITLKGFSGGCGNQLILHGIKVIPASGCGFAHYHADGLIIPGDVFQQIAGRTLQSLFKEFLFGTLFLADFSFGETYLFAFSSGIDQSELDNSSCGKQVRILIIEFQKLGIGIRSGGFIGLEQFLLQAGSYIFQPGLGG